MGTQYSVDHITPLVYLVREYGNLMNNAEIDQSTIQDATVNGTLLTGEAYRGYNIRFWKVIHKITIGAPAWAHVRIFERAQDRRGAWNTLKSNSEGKPQMIWRKEDFYSAIDTDSY